MFIDHYAQMRRELVSLWEILKQNSKSQSEINHKISNINNIALHIGGKVQDDVEQLKRDVHQFLEGSLDKKAIEQMFLDALKLEQETREL
jgi:hypothetical protein